MTKNLANVRAILAPLVSWAACVALAVCLVLGPAHSAHGAKKVKEEVAVPTKSYTMPYLIVIAFLGIGLMTVCRPSSRLDKLGDRIQKEEKE